MVGIKVAIITALLWAFYVACVCMCVCVWLGAGEVEGVMRWESGQGERRRSEIEWDVGMGGRGGCRGKAKHQSTILDVHVSLARAYAQR